MQSSLKLVHSFVLDTGEAANTLANKASVDSVWRTQGGKK